MSNLQYLGLTTPDNKALPLKKTLREGNDARYGWTRLLEDPSGKRWIVNPTNTVDAFIVSPCSHNAGRLPGRPPVACGCGINKGRCSQCGKRGSGTCSCYEDEGLEPHKINNKEIWVSILGESWARSPTGDLGEWLGILDPVSSSFIPATEPEIE
jgi:hypothetical protein